MASSGPINGTDLRIYLGGNAVAYATSFQMSMSKNVNELIHKDNPGGGWREIDVKKTTKQATITVEALYAEDGANNAPVDLFGLFDGDAAAVVSAKTSESGDTSFDGSGYVTALDVTGPVNEIATYSATIEVTGAIASGSVT